MVNPTFFLHSSPPLCLGPVIQHDLVAVDVELVVRARHIFVRLDAHLCALVRVVCNIVSGCSGRRSLSLFRHYEFCGLIVKEMVKVTIGFENFSGDPSRKLRFVRGLTFR